ncbi:MAG: acetate--CoA ligase family protein [Thermodesulfovibrio sp.]|uniref:acetate--CoA ligase alpha subunit n=1 Tax=unclassified Thermodesulfovibrio TaxID=2645936 RepID=UPI00083B3A75|nr:MULTISPECIES: acetate--CoA ligase [unclassified Thermodesulfovibrio]MDI1471570.1 acetate--CoA ligase family protein [Thermodesulfovibrio sp. 1176]MDI6715105.1 acetate--CoA ligase family protein [Thermodesulfovibrio sp.]ODA44685.1 putative Acetyl-CoA synthetase (ADP-forming) alpha and beta chains [Thermodesulfovibrio sp. N1]
MIDAIFNPNSIAVIGASAEEKKVGHAVLKNLLQGFVGKIYPINPSKNEILSLPCYPSVSVVPDKIDLAIIVIPAKAVADALMDCSKAGVKGVVVITAGFKEVGGEGVDREREIISIVRNSGMRMVGPNCLGVMNTKIKMNASFAAEMPPEGRVAFFSQSGALGVAIIDWALENNFGFSKFVSFGNKADLNETDFLEYFAKDSDTDVILGYIEDIVDGKKFLNIAKEVTKIKPVILIKSGATEAGARAASSHTGALAGSDRAFTEAFRKTGIIRVNGIQELFDTAEMFISKKQPKGKRLLIITNAGGPGIIAADTADKLGIKLDPMSRASIDTIAEKLPSSASLYNPVDVIGDATSDRYKVVLEQAIKDEVVQGICVILTPQAMTDVDNVADVVIATSNKTDKPIFTTFIGGQRIKNSIKKLKENRIPNFTDPSVAINAYSKLINFVELKNKKISEEHPLPIPQENILKVEKIIKKMQESGISEIGGEEALEILSLYGFTFPERALAKTPMEAVAIAERIGYPVVMKISSPHILHKTDVGGVKLNLNNEKAVYNAFIEITTNVKRFMPDAFIEGVMVYEMVTGGKEVILGVSYDRTFGHMIMFGLGGIYVEVLKDVSFRIVPITEEEAFDMINEIKGSRILDGVRGEKPYDKKDIANCLRRLSRLVEDFPIIKEVDINPYLVMNNGGIGLDARIII